ncbi:MAG: hypothetical protein QOF48_1911 [Verrucomicrobiota bacterium]|jgi:hypothetical protein
MKCISSSVLFLACVILMGCNKKPAASGNVAVPQTPTVSQPVMAAWQRGDKSAAAKLFIETDWSARPLFAPESVLGLSEPQFVALRSSDRQVKTDELFVQLDALKRLASEVAQAGRDAAAGGDMAAAQKHFWALKQFGTNLDTTNNLRVVQLVGQAMTRIADAEMGKVGR